MPISYSGVEILKDAQKTKFCDRIEFLIENRGVSKSWVASRLGITKQALNYLIKHSSKPKYVDSFAEILRANPSWIEFGEGRPYKNDPIKEQKNTLTKLKVFDSTSIVSFIEGNEPEGTYDLIDYPEGKSKDFIAYRIQNDSLFPPFLENTVLIFQKHKLPATGDYVLITLKEDDSVLVRQYSKDGKDIYFNPKNITYKSLINVDAIILGVLVEARYLL
jgi:SOS-response transcriptional repressor LexA